ncbi:hypothetical protein DFH29DRAFT_880596 [Suillus ampliporus]|nr:hypothetical protein DFH29DRAFT_880596 [Suillus ampliporus]
MKYLVSVSTNHPMGHAGMSNVAGLVAGLTLLQNGIPVRIIDKDPNSRIRQRGRGIWPRSLELFNFLNVPEVNNLGKLVPVHIPKMIGQQLLDVVVQRHLEKFSCSVEMGAELLSFKQSGDGDTAVLAKNSILETLDTKWMIGAAGARSIKETEGFAGVVRKQLGLTFLCSTRDDFRIGTGDIRLKGVGLDRVASLFSTYSMESCPDPVSKHFYRFGSFSERSLSLRPTDEIGEDGWRFFTSDHELELTKIAQSEELIFETIASFIPAEITFNKLVWFNLGWKLALVEKGLAGKSLLETYSAERLPVISEMLEMTTSILNQAIITGDVTIQRSPTLFMLGINCRFSSIVFDEFTTPVKRKPINTYGVFDEGHLEAGDRAPDAPDVLQAGCGESDVKTLFGQYRPWYHTVLVFAPSLADATPILGDKSVMHKAVVLPSSAPVAPVTFSCADVVLVDQEGYAYSAYHVEANQTKVFVTRPDGVIGAIVHGEEGVKKYFSKIFLDL